MDPKKTESSLELQCPKRDSVVNLYFTREHLVPLSKSCFFYGVNVPAVIWLTGNELLTRLLLSLLASSIESLEANIKVIVAVMSVK